MGSALELGGGVVGCSLDDGGGADDSGGADEGGGGEVVGWVVGAADDCGGVVVGSTDGDGEGVIEGVDSWVVGSTDGSGTAVVPASVVESVAGIGDDMRVERGGSEGQNLVGRSALRNRRECGQR